MSSSPAPDQAPTKAKWFPAPSTLQLLYLVLAVLGAILPWLANLDYIRASGGAFEISDFIAQANANPAASSLARDLGIGASAVLVWMIAETRRLKLRGLPWVLLCCFSVAFACAAPLFLYLRDRRLAELDREGGKAEVSAGRVPTVPDQP